MIQLRPYQQEFVDNIRKKLFERKRVIACAATGSGKTKTFLAITQMAIDKKKTVLIISESTKIFKQISDEMGSAIEISAKVKSLDIKQNSVYIAMSQTLVRRPEIIKQFRSLGKNLIIITDEIHVGTPQTLLQQLQSEIYHIGFTATPLGKHLPLLYDDIVIGPQPQWLVENSYLSPYYHYERQVVDISKLKKSSTGDFTEKSQEEAFEKRQVYDGIFVDIKKFPYKKAMVFCASISHSESVGRQFRSHGYNVAVVHSKNGESTNELAKFQNLTSGVDVCVSVGSLQKGFDFPAIDLVILLRSTLSLPCYLQMIGRGSRMSEFTNKQKFICLDYGSNASRHNTWNIDRDWDVLWKGKEKEEKGVPPIKCCPQCGFITYASALICPECKFVFPKSVAPPQETELIMLNTEYNELKGRKISTLDAKSLSVYAKSTNKKNFAIRIAKSKNDMKFLQEFAFNMGYKQGWTYSQYTDEKIEFHDITIK